MFDLKVRIHDHDFALGNAGDAEPSTERVPTLKAENFFAGFILQESCVSDVATLDDIANVGVIRCRRSRDYQCGRVREETVTRLDNN